LVGTTKVYSGVGADIVMESITLIDRVAESNRLLSSTNRCEDKADASLRHCGSYWRWRAAPV